MRWYGRANPPAWIIAKHKIQSAPLPPRISLLLKDFLPMKTCLSQAGTGLESWLLCAVISNYHSMERWLTERSAHSEKWVGGCQSRARVWAMTMPTVPAQLLLRHESQAHASSAAMLTLEEDKREIGRKTSRGLGLALLSNVGGLPWAVTKCSYDPLIGGLIENHNNSCMADTSTNTSTLKVIPKSTEYVIRYLYFFTSFSIYEWKRSAEIWYFILPDCSN